MNVSMEELRNCFPFFYLNGRVVAYNELDCICADDDDDDDITAYTTPLAANLYVSSVLMVTTYSHLCCG